MLRPASPLLCSGFASRAFAVGALLSGCVALAAPPDFTRRTEVGHVIPTYPVPYVVPAVTEVKAILDRIRDRAIATTSFHVYDRETGAEILVPDLAHLNPNAVVDRRLGGLNGWDYTNGVVLSAFRLISDATGDSRYFDQNVRFFDWIFAWQPYFAALEAKTGRRNEFSTMNHMGALDHCGAIGCALIRTQAKHPDPRYAAWIDRIATYIRDEQFRLEDGTLARQRPQPRSLWTDDFYMAVPFLAHLGHASDQSAAWDDAARQVVQLSARLFVPERGLYAHGWSDNSDGVGPRFYWGRANGWATLAMAELLAVLPADHPQHTAVLRLYRQHLRTLVELQDGSGLWHNLLDRSDTYLETSASAMFVYSLAKGVDEGWLSASFAPAALTGWNAIAARVLPDGRVDGICEGTTYANDSTYYTHRGAGPDTTFFGAVLYAGLEVMKLLQNPALQLAAPQPGAVNSALHVRRAEDLPKVRS